MTGPADPRSVATGRPRTTSQTPTTVRSRRVGAASRRPSGLKAKSPRGQRRASVTGSTCSTVTAAVDRVGGGQFAALPVDAENPQALAVERQGRELVRARPRTPRPRGSRSGSKTLTPPIPQPQA